MFWRCDPDWWRNGAHALRPGATGVKENTPVAGCSFSTRPSTGGGCRNNRLSQLLSHCHYHCQGGGHHLATYPQLAIYLCGAIVPLHRPRRVQDEFIGFPRARRPHRFTYNQHRGCADDDDDLEATTMLAGTREATSQRRRREPHAVWSMKGAWRGGPGPSVPGLEGIK